MAARRRVRIHKEGRNIIIGLTLLIFVLNVGVYFYVPHWVFAITLLSLFDGAASPKSKSQSETA